MESVSVVAIYTILTLLLLSRWPGVYVTYSCNLARHYELPDDDATASKHVAVWYWGKIVHSLVIEQNKKKHYCNVYIFCRWKDMLSYDHTHPFKRIPERISEPAKQNAYISRSEGWELKYPLNVSLIFSSFLFCRGYEIFQLFCPFMVTSYTLYSNTMSRVVC